MLHSALVQTTSSGVAAPMFVTVFKWKVVHQEGTEQENTLRLCNTARVIDALDAPKTNELTLCL